MAIKARKKPRSSHHPSADEAQALAQSFLQRSPDETEALALSLTAKFPQHGFAWKILSVLYQDQQRYEESLRAAEQAIAWLADDAAPHNNLGITLLQLKRFDEAEIQFRKALEIAPGYAKALVNLAALLRLQGKLDESEACCRRALEAEPLYLNAHIALGNALEMQNLLPQARACYKDALSISPKMTGLHTDLLHLTSLDVTVEPHELLAEHLAFGERLEAPLRPAWPIHDNVKDPQRQLHIGFVSGDLFDHAMANYLAPMFTHLARNNWLSVHLYFSNTKQDAITQRIRSTIDNWNDVAALDDDQLCAMIRGDRIDILVDLCGHTVHNRLATFARKPAPVQLSWLGYLGTTGLQAMDYYLCDPYWIPPELSWQFVEKLAYMPAAMSFEPNTNSPEVNALPALNNGHFTFASFNRANKINPSVVILWSSVLKRTPDSTMVFGGIPTEFQGRLAREFEQQGVASSRLMFFARTSQVDYLRLHHKVDLCLDTFPHGGGATTAHAAWMGVPTLALAGEGPASRFGAAQLHHLGLDEFVATSIDDFVAKAVYWSQNLTELADTRLTLRARFQASPIGNHALLAFNFDALVRTIWRRWCANLPADMTNIDHDLLIQELPAAQIPQEPSLKEIDQLGSLFSQGLLDESVSLALGLTNRFPAHGFAWKILGAALHAQGKLQESLTVHEHVVGLRPQDHEAHFNLACELQKQGHLDRSVRSYLSCLSLRADNAHAYCNLGNIFKLSGLAPQAEDYCRQAIAIDPLMEKAHNNLGNALHAQGKYTQALASYKRALDLRPEWSEVHNNMAITLKDQGYWVQAKEHFRKALAIKPQWSQAHSNLLYCLSHDVQTEPQPLCAEHIAFGERFEAPLKAQWQAHGNNKDPNRCLQVGFVSGDLYDHALTNFLEPAFKALSGKASLTLHAYCTHILEDSVTQRMRSYFPHWHAVANLSDSELANKIRADGIDILIDLSGHTAHNRLLTFARKPAPIQASWLGYLGTSGLQAMDYYLCDSFWIPQGKLDWQFTEKMAYLPTAAVFQPSELAPEVNELPALKNGFITFGSFNRPNKLNDSVIVLWSKLLQRVPNSRMVLGGVPPDVQARLLDQFEMQNVAPDRLDFYPRSSLATYLGLHHQVDLCLDTFPFGGGATTVHAAWMGVPTLSLAGASPPSRFGASLIHHLDLDEFIATSIDEFVSIGAGWTQSLPRLATVRSSLRARFKKSQLGQPGPFATTFTELIRTMWHSWCSERTTTTLNVNGLSQPRLTAAQDAPFCGVEEPHSVTPVVEKSFEFDQLDFKTTPVLDTQTYPCDGPLQKVRFVVATRASEAEFFTKTAAGRSIALRPHPQVELKLFADNRQGLSAVYNTAIDESQNDPAVLIFMHDDVHLLDYFWHEQIRKALERFDVVGIAGNSRRVPRQPAWAFIDSNFTWDSKGNLSGIVGHGTSFPPSNLSVFGPPTQPVKLLDGLFLAVDSRRLIDNQLRFDEQFEFHFYDMDFCRQVENCGLTMGTWPLSVIHESAGHFGSGTWKKGYDKYLAKWGS